MLKPTRQEVALNNDFVSPDTSERGGLLHHQSVSGVDMARYVADPSGKVPIGFQFHDVEYIDYSRQYDPRRLRETVSPCEIVAIFTEGELETDWIHAVGTPVPGGPAYAGPSGTITDSAAYGGTQIGYFLGPLKRDRHLLVYRGLGFTTSYQECGTHNIVTENNPDDRVFVISDGYIRVRINQRIITRSLTQ